MTSEVEGTVKQSRVGVGTHPRLQFKILTSERIAKSVLYSLVPRVKPGGSASYPVPYESVNAC